MPNITTVNLTAGSPTGPAGASTVSTIDALMADGGQATIGAKADAKASTSDATPISGISIWKQISFSIQALVTAFGAAWTRGAGAADANTQRVTVDSGQLSPLGQTIMSASAPVVLASDQSTIPTIAKPSATANGQTSSRVNAAATTNATSLKASAGQVGEIDVFNAAAYTVFLKLYNKASAPTVGTDTPVWTIPIQAGGGFAKTFPRGKTFATGIAYAITKLQADSDTTVVVAGDLTGSIDWI